MRITQIQNEVTKLLDHSKALVFPSCRRESAAAMTYLEALAVGRPTLPLGDNAVADDVATSGAGAVISDFPDLVEGIAALSARLSDASLAAHRRYHAKFSEQSWVRRISRIYDSVVR